MGATLSSTKNYQDLFQTFSKWTGKARYSVLYDSTCQDISQFSFSNSVKNKSNVMIIIKAEGSIFGCYTSELLKYTEEERTMEIVNDKKHFVFVFKPEDMKIERFSKFDPVDKSLIVFNQPKQNTAKLTSPANYPSALLCCYGAFVIESEMSQKRSSIDYSFEGNYDARKGITADIFLGKKYFMYDNLIALEWL